MITSSFCRRVAHALAAALLSTSTLPTALADAPDDPLLVAPAPALRQLGSWEDAVSLQRGSSNDLRIAADELLRARGQERAALGGLLPSLDGNGLASFSLLPVEGGGSDDNSGALFGSETFQTLSLVAGLRVIDLQAWNALAQARASRKVALLSLADARRVLTASLAQALIAAVTSERMAEIARAGLRDALSRQSLAERAHRGGASTEIDLARVRQDSEAARAQVVTADETLRQAREQLGLTLGLADPVGVQPSFQLNGLAERARSGCTRVDALSARPDLLAARERERVARRGVDDVRAQYAPSVALRSTAQAYFIPDAGTFRLWNLQAVLTVPLWDGGIREGSLRAAKAQRSQAAQRRMLADRTATIEVARAERGIGVAESARAIATRALEQATRNDALTRRAYDVGVGTSLELVTSAALLRQQQLNLALREFDVLRAKVAAIFALSDCPS
ncbi:MAG: TolC family protein [Polyangiales bacterium]